MYSSWFHYRVSRPYPFRWFTPLIIVGGIVFTVVFSIINFGSYGFQLATRYTNDPNTTVTEAQSKWYFKAPFNWGNQVRISCEAQSLPVGYQFFTSNFGLRYELTYVSKNVTGSDVPQQLPSVSYLNNTLENCFVDHIEIYLHKADWSIPPSDWPSWDDSSSAASGACTITNSNDNGIPTTVGFRTALGNPGTFGWIVNSDPTSHASLWWGSRLLSVYYHGVLETMARVPVRPETFTKGLLSYFPQIIDSNADDSFILAYYILVANSQLWNNNGVGLTFDEMRNDYFQSPMIEGLQFAKMFRALIEADFGANYASNPLLNDALLQETILNVGNPNREAGGVLNDTNQPNQFNGINWPGTVANASNSTWINETYRLFSPVMGSLGTRNTTIYAQYACSVPEAKSTAILLLAILLANIVFLQALWRLTTLGAEALVEKQDSRALWCLGCLEQVSGTGDIKDYANEDTARLMADDSERQDGEVIRMRHFT